MSCLSWVGQLVRVHACFRVIHGQSVSRSAGLLKSAEIEAGTKSRVTAGNLHEPVCLADEKEVVFVFLYVSRAWREGILIDPAV